MDVWLLRHAAAEDNTPSGRDEDRSLTAEGRSRASRVARGLAALSPGIDAVLCSPYLRARETAEAAASALGLGKPAELPALEPGRAPEDLAGELSSGRWRAPLLVGHQPLLGALAGFLVFGDARLEIALRKGAVARISWAPGGAGTLEALLPPAILERLPAGG